MLHRTAPLLRLALALPLSACAADDDTPDADAFDYPAWASKSDELGSGLTSTRDAVVQIFDGYNHVTDTPNGRNCVLPQAGQLERAAFAAGGDTLTTEIRYIDTREDLEEALEIDAQATIKVGPLGGGAGLGLAKTYKSSDKSLAILLRTRQMYTVINQERHNITSDALAILKSDANTFVRECGTGYVAGVAYGAELSLLVQIETKSVQESMQVKSRLEAQGIKAGPATIDSKLGMKFDTALSQQSVTVSVNVEARGFVPSVDINALGALDSAAFDIAGKAQQELQASVANDKCHDQGSSGPGSCGGTAARGYLANGARASVPMGVLHLPFSRAANMPSDKAVVDGLVAVQRDADKAIAVLEAYADLYRSMIGVHNDEARAMLDATAPFEFGVYDPSDAFRPEVTFDGLRSHAETWAAAYDPTKGTEVKKLADLVDVCWSRAQFGDFADCQVFPEDTPGGVALIETFGQYGQTRIRPLSYTFATAVQEWDHAPEQCPAGFRAPTAAEASRIWFAIERDPAIPACSDFEAILQTDRGAWFDDKGIDCPNDEGAFIERLASGQYATGCHRNSALADDPELVALCVPTSGVYGSSVPDLPSP